MSFGWARRPDMCSRHLGRANDIYLSLAHPKNSAIAHLECNRVAGTEVCRNGFGHFNVLTIVGGQIWSAIYNQSQRASQVRIAIN